MALPFQAFLEDFAYPEGSDFSELDSEQTQVIQIDLPDLEETQIMQNKDDAVSRSQSTWSSLLLSIFSSALQIYNILRCSERSCFVSKCK